MIKQYYYIQCLFTIIVSFFLVVFFNKTCPAASASKDFNIVLITIDALRADHLSCYGYDRTTSPNIDKIAENGIIFKNAIAPSSWTAPSMVSLFTSVYPINHGVIHGLGYIKNKDKQEVFSDKLITLAETLKAQGYTTVGVAANLHLSEEFGFARGFDYFKCLPFSPAQPVNKAIYSWEDKIKKSDKFFLWVHYIDPHHPYHARDPWLEHYTTRALTRELKLSEKPWGDFLKLIPDFEEYPKVLSNLVALYDSEINYVDSYIGELIQRFELDKNTLIIITADHGEGFLEHGQLGHGTNLYQETIHIPLIVKLPHSSKKKIANKYVNLLDIMPSILKTLNTNPPKQTAGKSIFKKKGPLSWLKKTLLRKDSSDYIFTELDTNITLKTIITSKWKYLYNYRDKTDQLYNIKSDPWELDNIIDYEFERSNKLKEQLFDWVENSNKYPTKIKSFQLSPEERKKLEAMGYLQVTDDIDKDGIPDNDDNCPYVFNPNQKDTYPPGGNGIGDACDCEGDFNCDGNVNALDAAFISGWFKKRTKLSNPCTNENPCYGDFDCDGDVDNDDKAIFYADFGRSKNNNPCPPCEVEEWCSY
ncbi:MAG: sulfatase-like hydrolase/transferase [Deltaproteobacteria bacterium]|nr:sulfatase-like hydrolase/transferase [Deltaproteobacteria bacterium]